MCVLFNLNPYGYNIPHFLVTPLAHKHKERFNHLSLQAVRESNQLTLALVSLLHKQAPDKNILVFVQSGPSAGQTVPHAHRHVLINPDLLNLSILFMRSFLGLGNKGLSPEELKEKRTQYSRPIQHEVQKIAS
jgi:galactose-1-phosphate uridylyltransferase